MDGSQFIIALLALIATVVIAMIVGFWTIASAINTRFEEIEKSVVAKDETVKDLLFKRLDNVKIGASDTYVRKDLYEAEKKAADDKINIRLTSMMEILTGKFENVEKSMIEFRSFIKENFTNHVKHTSGN